MRTIECPCCAKSAATLAARDAEIYRLKEKAIRFDLDRIGIESRERDAVELVEARAEIERLKALVEKRERQLVWALRACSDDEALKFYSLDILAISDDDAGLLAAIDEATAKETDESRQSRPESHQRCRKTD